jgi:hypothetical protein
MSHVLTDRVCRNSVPYIHLRLTSLIESLCWPARLSTHIPRSDSESSPLQRYLSFLFLCQRRKMNSMLTQLWPAEWDGWRWSRGVIKLFNSGCGGSSVVYQASMDGADLWLFGSLMEGTTSQLCYLITVVIGSDDEVLVRNGQVRCFVCMHTDPGRTAPLCFSTFYA